MSDLIFKGVSYNVDAFGLVVKRDPKLQFVLGRDKVFPRNGRPIQQNVIHTTGGENPASTCYRTLRNRGLSVHAYMDDAGVVTQYCDLDYVCQHAGSPTNGYSVAIEIKCKLYAPALPRAPRGVYKTDMHDKPRSFLFLYPEQVEAAIAWCRAVSKLTGIPLALPRVHGVVPQTVVPIAIRKKFKGVLAHYHISYKKGDPGPQLINEFKDEGW